MACQFILQCKLEARIACGWWGKGPAAAWWRWLAAAGGRQAGSL